MKTKPEMIAMVENELRNVRDMEKALWENYDAANSDMPCMTALNYMSDIRSKLSEVKHILSK